MPLAFSNAGLWFGLIATILIGIICTHCIHILVKCSHILCKRTETPSQGFSEIAEMAFVKGPPGLQKYSQTAKLTIDLFLVVDLLGCCCIYIVFFAANMKQMVEYYSPETNLNIRIYMATLLLPLVVMNLVKNLKFLTPFSLIANILIGIGLIITFYYIFTDLPSVNDRPAIANIKDMPMFFGTVIFALQCIGVVMSLENDMRNPSHFIGCPGVLNFGMAFVTVLFAAVGFMGYLKYGENIEASVTLNLPVGDILAQSVKIMIAVAIFLSYSLQFYVPMGIIWKIIREKFNENNQNKAENFLRVFLVVSFFQLNFLKSNFIISILTDWNTYHCHGYTKFRTFHHINWCNLFKWTWTNFSSYN